MPSDEQCAFGYDSILPPSFLVITLAVHPTGTKTTSGKVLAMTAMLGSLVPRV